MGLLLPFQQALVGDLLQEDGLCILAPGVGLHQVVAVLLRLQGARLRQPAQRGVVLVLGASAWQRDALRRELARIDPLTAQLGAGAGAAAAAAEGEQACEHAHCAGRARTCTPGQRRGRQGVLPRPAPARPAAPPLLIVTIMGQACCVHESYSWRGSLGSFSRCAVQEAVAPRR